MRTYGSVLAQHGHGHSHSHTSPHTHASLHRPLVSANLSLLSPLVKTCCWHFPNSILGFLASNLQKSHSWRVFVWVYFIFTVCQACVCEEQGVSDTHTLKQMKALPILRIPWGSWQYWCDHWCVYACVRVAGVCQYSYMYAVSVPCVRVTSKIWRGQERKRKKAKADGLKHASNL